MRVLAQPKGLVLDQNAIVPQNGALRAATHVVCDQPGVVRARPTNDLHLAKTGGFRPRAIRVFGGEVVSISTDGDEWQIEDEGAVIAGNAIPPGLVPRMEEARSALYHTSSTGIRRFTAGDAATLPAGVEAHVGPMARGVVGVSPALGTTLAGGPLPGTPLEGRVYFDAAHVIAGDVFEWYKTLGSTDYAVSVVIRRTDANGYVRRSPPTLIYLSGTALPGTDAFLWQSYTITSADVSAGYFLVARVISVAPDENEVFVPDVVNDDLLGEALYTNPGQAGALGARYAPPLAHELALFSGCMWYANTTSKNRVTTSIVNVAGSTNTANVDDTNPVGLLGAITAGTLANVTTTNLSTSVTGLSDDYEKFLRVGMFMTDATNTTAATAGTAFQADTLLVSWAAGVAPGTIDLVVSKACTATGARDVLLGDVVSVGGRNFYAWAQDEIWSPDTGLASGRRVFGIPNTTITATGRNAYAAASLAAAVNYEAIFDSAFQIRARLLGEPFVYSTTVSNPADLLFEEIGVGGTAFTIDTSDPDAFSPSLPLTSKDDEEAGRLWWSLPDEPEAVPLPNFLRVGRPDQPILALTPLRSSMLVWKTDGLFRVSGVAPNSWRVDAVNDTVRLISGSSVAVDDGVAYAWTDSGIVRATEDGVQVVSQQIDEILSAYAATVLDDPTLVGSWAVPWRIGNLVLFGFQGGTGSEMVLALSTVTGQWSTFWERGTEEVLCATYDPIGARLYWSRGEAWEIRIFDRACTGSDREYSLANVTCSTPFTTMTIAAADLGTWVPREGDWLRRTTLLGSAWARITSASNGATWSLTFTPALGGGTAEGVTWFGYEGLRCVMDWQNVSPAGAWSRVREVQAHVDGDVSGSGPGTLYLAMGGATDFSAVATVDGTVALPTSVARPYRYGAPRAVSMAAHFFPRVEINAFGFGWRLHALAVVGEPSSDRVRR